MFRPYILATIVACGLSAAACGTDSSPTAPESASAPSLRTVNNTPGPGATVFRGPAGFFSTWRGDGFLVEIGASAKGVAEFCSGAEDFEDGVALEHFVERPNGGESSLFKSDGKVALLLFPESAEDICSAPPVAQGTGLYTDNGSNFLGGKGRANSSTRFRGQVTDKSGRRHHVLVLIHAQLRRDGFHFIVDKVKVN
jgi:hypothetical protein